MPVKSRELDAIVRLGLGERDSKLVQVLAHDGIRAVQIVRGWDDLAKGPPSSSMASLIARLEQNADAGRALDTTSSGLGAQGLRRYVANPYVGDAQFDGFWVGGPLQIGDAYDEGRGVRNRGLRQTLTLVHAAGHTLGVDTDGFVTSADGTTADALAALKAMRPVYRVGGATEEAYTDTFPDGDFAEFAWRFLTHESAPKLNALTAEQVAEAVNAFAGEERTWRPTEWVFSIDPETNGGVWTAKAVAKDAVVPASAADLASAPHHEQPAERRRVRIFGLGHEKGGEGLSYSVKWVWRDIAASSQPIVQFVREAGFAQLCMGSASNTPWKVADTLVERQDDGLLRLTVEFSRVEFDNEAATVRTDESNPGGWGSSRRELIPSVATENAENVLAGAAVPQGHVLGRRSVSESSQGFADVTSDYERVWSYSGGDAPPNLPTYRGMTAPEIEWRPNYCTGGGGVVLTFPRVAREAQDSVLAYATGGAVRSAVEGSRLRSVRISGAENGSETIRVEYTTRLTAAEFSRIVSSDFFTNVYRREYDGLDIDAAGAVRDSSGAPFRVVDALGNEVPTVNVSGGTVLFRKGVRISVQFSRDAECKYHATVTTEVAVAREWGYEHQTNRGGHPQTVRVRVWRNFDERPAPETPAHGSAADYRDDINAFGLHDGQSSASPDLHEERATSSSGDLFSTTERETAHHAATPPAAMPGLNGREITSVEDRVSSDGLHDTTVARERAGSEVAATIDYSVKRGGHDVHVRETSYRNAGTPKTPSGTRAGGASAQLNRFNLFDGSVQEQDDIREVSRRTESDDALTHTSRTDTMLGGDGFASASASPGEVVTKTVTEYSDNTYDTSETRETAKMKKTEMSWGEKRGGHDIRVRHTVTQNGEAPSVSAGADERVNVSAGVNRFGKVDSTVHSETDVYIKRRVERGENAFQSVERVTENVSGSGDARSSGGDGGPLVSGSDETYSDDLHDTTSVTVTPKAKSWDFRWNVRYGPGDGEVAQAAAFFYRNWPSIVADPLGVAGEVRGDFQYNAHPSWEMNGFGLYDGSVTYVPKSATGRQGSRVAQLRDLVNFSGVRTEEVKAGALPQAASRALKNASHEDIEGAVEVLRTYMTFRVRTRQSWHTSPTSAEAASGGASGTYNGRTAMPGSKAEVFRFPSVRAVGIWKATLVSYEDVTWWADVEGAAKSDGSTIVRPVELHSERYL